MEHTIYLTIGDLEDRYKRHRATVYRWIKRGLFPPPRRMTPGTSLWPLNEVEVHDRDPEAWRRRHAVDSESGNVGGVRAGVTAS